MLLRMVTERSQVLLSDAGKKRSRSRSFRSKMTRTENIKSAFSSVIHCPGSGRSHILRSRAGASVRSDTRSVMRTVPLFVWQMRVFTGAALSALRAESAAARGNCADSWSMMRQSPRRIPFAERVYTENLPAGTIFPKRRRLKQRPFRRQRSAKRSCIPPLMALCRRRMRSRSQRWTRAIAATRILLSK